MYSLKVNILILLATTFCLSTVAEIPDWFAIAVAIIGAALTFSLMREWKHFDQKDRTLRKSGTVVVLLLIASFVSCIFPRDVPGKADLRRYSGSFQGLEYVSGNLSVILNVDGKRIPLSAESEVNSRLREFGRGAKTVVRVDRHHIVDCVVDGVRIASFDDYVRQTRMRAFGFAGVLIVAICSYLYFLEGSLTWKL